MKDLQQKAVSSQQESKDFQQRVVSSQQEIKVLTNQVTHITKVYVVSYQAILRRSLLHNARKSICEELDKMPLRDAKTGYLKWNSALTDILNSTEPWLSQKFTRQNATFVLANSDIGVSEAHPNIYDSIVPLAFSVTAANVSPEFQDLFCRCLPGYDPHTVIGLV